MKEAIRRILVPTVVGEPAAAALEYATAIRRARLSRITYGTSA